MVKETNIMLRVQAEEKRRIEAAAQAKGLSVTRFVVDASLREAAKVEARSAEPRGPKVARGHLPIYFQACCRTASEGGTQSYRWVGNMLLGHLESECPYEFELDEWSQRLDELGDLLTADDSDGDVVAWFRNYLPRFIDSVPPRRRSIFVAGMRERYAEQRFD